MNLNLRSIFLLVLLLATGRLLAQTSFSATVNPGDIGKNDYVQLDLTVTNGSGTPEISLPALKQFKVAGGPSVATGFMNNNGVSSTTYTLSYVLKPLYAGNLLIPAATAKVGGREFKSNPVQVRVSNTATSNNSNRNNSSFFGPAFPGGDPFEQQEPEIPVKDYVLKSGENVEEKVKKNIFIKVEVNRSTCYVGEPVVATYKLYTRLKSESNITQNPSFNGFSVVDLLTPDVNAYSRANYNGREYNVYIIRQAQLYPLQDGKLELEAAEVENDVRFIKDDYLRQNGNDPFLLQNFSQGTLPPEAMVEQKIAVKSEPCFINVKALPELNKPASFSGAVGEFNITANLEKNNFSTDDAGKLQIVINGMGNMQLITAPIINWPAGFDAYESKFTDQVQKTNVPISGTRSFEYPFTVAAAGNYNIPSVEFGFFDSKTNAYKIVKTAPIAFTVTQGTGRPSDSVKIKEPENQKFFNHIFSNRWIIIIPVVLLVLLGLFLWLRKEQKNDRAAKEKAALEQEAAAIQLASGNQVIEEMADPLENVKEMLLQDNPKRFYQALHDDLYVFLSKKLSIPAEELNRKIIAEKMDKYGISNELSIRLQQLMEEVELQLYTPFADAGNMNDTCRQADQLVQELKLGFQASVNL